MYKVNISRRVFCECIDKAIEKLNGENIVKYKIKEKLMQLGQYVWDAKQSEKKVREYVAELANDPILQSLIQDWNDCVDEGDTAFMKSLEKAVVGVVQEDDEIEVKADR